MKLLCHPLDEYRSDYRANDYWTLLRAAASAAGAPETIAARARLLGCGRDHAKTVATNLVRKRLVRLNWDEERREWRLRVTDAGSSLLDALDRLAALDDQRGPDRGARGA